MGQGEKQNEKDVSEFDKWLNRIWKIGVVISIPIIVTVALYFYKERVETLELYSYDKVEDIIIAQEYVFNKQILLLKSKLEELEKEKEKNADVIKNLKQRLLLFEYLNTQLVNYQDTKNVASSEIIGSILNNDSITDLSNQSIIKIVSIKRITKSVLDFGIKAMSTKDTIIIKHNYSHKGAIVNDPRFAVTRAFKGVDSTVLTVSDTKLRFSNSKGNNWFSIKYQEQFLEVEWENYITNTENANIDIFFSENGDTLNVVHRVNKPLSSYYGTLFFP